MSAAPFASAPAVTPKMTRVMFYLLRKYSPTGMKRSKVLFLENYPSNDDTFQQIEQLMRQDNFTAEVWEKIFDLAWRVLGICFTPNINFFYYPHTTLGTIRNNIPGNNMAMVYQPTSIPVAYLDPFHVMLEAINDNAPREDVIASIVTETRPTEEAELLYKTLERHVAQLHIEPIVPFDRTEESYRRS